VAKHNGRVMESKDVLAWFAESNFATEDIA